MKQANELVQNALQNEPKTTMKHSSKLLEKKWVLGIFRKFSLRYGQQWSAKLEGQDMHDVIHEWQEVLGTCTADNIRKGMETWDSEFPPNVMQFRSKCLSTDEHWQHRQYQAAKKSPALPKPKLSKEEAAQRFAQLRQSLKYQPKPQEEFQASFAWDESAFEGENPYQQRKAKNWEGEGLSERVKETVL